MFIPKAPLSPSSPVENSKMRLLSPPCPSNRVMPGVVKGFLDIVFDGAPLPALIPPTSFMALIFI